MPSTDLTRFDLNLLVVLEALLAERHVGRAAARLHLSQSATSHALSRLRAALDDPLFIRNPKGIEPTPRVLALAPRLAAVLDEVRGLATRRGPFDPGRITRPFRVGATDYAVLTVLAPALASIHAAAPQATLRIDAVEPQSIVRRLDASELDLAIGAGSLAGIPRRIETIPLFEERFVGVARRGHPALVRRGARYTMTLDHFVATPQVLVSPKGDARGVVDDALQALQRSRQVKVTTASFIAAPFLVEAGDLLAVLAERAAQRLARSANLVCFDLPLALAPWTVYLGRSASRAAEPEIDWLTQMILKAQSLPKRRPARA